jgi:hypothetical protein
MTRRQVNFRPAPVTNDLLDLAVLIRQAKTRDWQFTRGRAAEEAVRAWALGVIEAEPELARISAVGLTVGAGAHDRDLAGLSKYLRAEPTTKETSAAADAIDDAAARPQLPDTTAVPEDEMQHPEATPETRRGR